MGGGVLAAVEGACIAAGGPATDEEAAALENSPVTCLDLANAYAAKCRIVEILVLLLLL